MLVLSRRINESVMIGEELKMTILSIKGKQIRIGFEGPSDIAIHREEVFLRAPDDDKDTSIDEIQ